MGRGVLGDLLELLVQPDLADGRSALWTEGGLSAPLEKARVAEVVRARAHCRVRDRAQADGALEHPAASLSLSLSLCL